MTKNKIFRYFTLKGTRILSGILLIWNNKINVSQTNPVIPDLIRDNRVTLSSRTSGARSGIYTMRSFRLSLLFVAIIVLILTGFALLLPAPNTNGPYPIKHGGIFSSYAYTGKAKDVQVSFVEKKSPDEIKVNLSDKSGSITMKVQADADNRQPTTDNKKLIFSDVYPDTDISYTLIRNGVKEDIIVKTREAVQNSYTFEITLDGFVPEYADSGEFTGRFVNPDDPDDFYRILPLYMEDAAGAVSYDLELFIEQTSEHIYQLQVIPDQRWLLSEDRQYPVLIDPSIVKGDAPVAHWQIDEGYGTALNDGSGNVNNLTISGATWQVNTPGAGSMIGAVSLQFDGTDDYASRAYDADFDFGTGSFSISAWFRHPSVIAGTDVLLARYSGAGFKVYMKSTGVVCFGIDDDSTWDPDDEACSTISLADSTWHHLEAVKDGTSSITLYVDGQQVAQDASLAATGSLSGTSPILYLGIDSDGTSNPWSGFIDQVAIYDYARSSVQVMADAVTRPQTAVSFGQTRDAFSDGLVGWWKMDEATTGTCVGATDACDSSGNAHHGTWAGNPTPVPGKFDRGLELDGDGDYVNLGNIELLD